jgi:hypothetical protein
MNSITQFVRIIITIFKNLFLIIIILFLNDISVKGLYTDYNEIEILLGIYRFVFEYLQNFNKTINRIERANTYIGSKSQFYYNSIGVINYIYNSRGRSSIVIKVTKIIDWPEKDLDIKRARTFIGVIIYYRIWIENFSIIATPIYYLFRKGIE